jgi:hypothetical protein
MLRDFHEQRIIDVKYFPTDAMLADMMTKPLPKDTQRHLVSSVQMQFE